MSEIEAKKRVQAIRKHYKTGLSALSAWNVLAPRIEEVDEQMAWLEESIDAAPSGISFSRNEQFLDYLENLKKKLLR